MPTAFDIKMMMLREPNLLMSNKTLLLMPYAVPYPGNLPRSGQSLYVPFFTDPDP